MRRPRIKWKERLAAENACAAKARWNEISKHHLQALRKLTFSLFLAVQRNELLLIGNTWYVSHAGLLRIAHRRHCFGIETGPTLAASSPANGRWVFHATVFKSPKCKGFTG